MRSTTASQSTDARKGTQATLLHCTFRFFFFLIFVLDSWYQRGVSRGITPLSKEYGKSQPLHALCFSLSRYRLNRPPLPCSEIVSPRPQIPPRSESKDGLPPRRFQRCCWLLGIVPQSAGLGSRTRAAAAASASEASAASAIVPQSTAVGGHTRDAAAAATAAASIDPAASEPPCSRCCVHVFSIRSPPLLVMEMFKLTTAPLIRPSWPQCPP